MHAARLLIKRMTQQVIAVMPTEVNRYVIVKNGPQYSKFWFPKRTFYELSTTHRVPLMEFPVEMLMSVTEPHDMIVFGRPNRKMPLSLVFDATEYLTNKGCYVMIAPLSLGIAAKYFSDYLVQPLTASLGVVTNWDPDLFV